MTNLLKKEQNLIDEFSVEEASNRYKKITPDILKRFWYEASELTYGLNPNHRFSTPELVDYLSEILPKDCEIITKTKINYLRKEGILNPDILGVGDVRTNWGYTPKDATLTLMTELLKSYYKLSIKEMKAWLHILEESLQQPFEKNEAQQGNGLANPAKLAYTLMRNRALGALILSLGRGIADVLPRDSIVAVRVITNPIGQVLVPKRIESWDEVKNYIMEGSWFIGGVDQFFKLYVYPGLERLEAHHSKTNGSSLKSHYYKIFLEDAYYNQYELILGLPQRDAQQPSNASIELTLSEVIRGGSILSLKEFPGLTTLFKAAFFEKPIGQGTSLFALAEIITSITDEWEYCAIMVPERSADGKEKWLIMKEFSSTFPLHLKDKAVEIGHFLSGWSYLYKQELAVERVVEGDARIAFYEEERPLSAIAVPAIAKDSQVVGVIYAARRKPLPEGRNLTEELKTELKTGLKLLGYICGDIIARDQIEVSTTREIARFTTNPTNSFKKFEDPEILIKTIVEAVRRESTQNNINSNSIYILTLNVETYQQDVISKWLCQQSSLLASEFLARQIGTSLLRRSLPIGHCEFSQGKFVFSIMTPIDLPEEEFKKAVTNLKDELQQMNVGQISPKFYLWAITFRCEDLINETEKSDGEETVRKLLRLTKEALAASPYISEGHDALRKLDLDRAVSEFEDALRYAPDNWYVLKHLAETRMIQGNYIPAIDICVKAIEKKENYASAYCLLADCYSYTGQFEEAVSAYEEALKLKENRFDFLIRYGLALSSLPIDRYESAINSLKAQKPKLAEQRTSFNEPYLDAIDKFDRARKLTFSYFQDVPGDNGQRSRQADYYYYRGFAHLQAGLFKKAEEDFAAGRKLAPDNLQLAQAYMYTLSLRTKGAQM